MGEALRSLLRATSSRCRPWQVSAAVSLGLLCGLLPKLSILFGLAALSCILLPIHLVLAAVVCLLTSLVATSVTTTIGNIGQWSLNSSPLSDFWLRLDSLPLIPWLALHNSVMHGSLLVGLMLLIPVFLCVLPVARRIAPSLQEVKSVTADPDFEHEIRPEVALVETRRWIASNVNCDPRNQPQSLYEASAESEESTEGSFSVHHTDEDTIVELQSLLASCVNEGATELSPGAIAERAAQIAEYVDELLSHSLDEEFHPKSIPQVATQDEVSATSETEISIFRRSDTDPALRTPMILSSESRANQAFSSTTEVDGNHGMQPAQARQLQLQTTKPTFPMSTETEKSQPSSINSLLLSSHGQDGSLRRVGAGVRQEEALRYLLHHLKALKEKV